MSAAAVARLLAGGDVAWFGSDLGLMAALPAEDDQLVGELDQGDVPALVDAMERPQSFVKAHVLLTRVTGLHRETFPTWNGLVVDLAADGSVHIDPAQRTALAERWQHWQAARDAH